MTPKGFEPTQLALVELESTPLDHSGKVSLMASRYVYHLNTKHRRHATAYVCDVSQIHNVYIDILLLSCCELRAAHVVEASSSR